MDYLGLVVLNYQLIRKLGEGGFGSVFLAEQKQLDRKAAIKILHPKFAGNDEVVERFFREAKAAYQIGHDSIIGVQNLGRLDTGEPFYVMEYFDGVTLSDHIEQVGPLALDSIVEIFDPVVGALAAAHDKGIVHRDLKPENIIVRQRDGCIEDVRLLDFGIAKLVDDTDMVNSMTGSPMGTPRYMAPEQARDSKNVDVRADVYSFGATLFHAVAGRPPFVNGNATDLMVAVQTQPAPALTLHAPSAPEQLEHIIARCLSKNPEERPASIRDTWGLVRDALEDRPAPAASSGTRPPPPRAKPDPKVEPRRLAPTLLRAKRQSERPATTRLWLWAVLAAGAIAYVAIARVATGRVGDAARRSASASAQIDIELEQSAVSADRDAISRIRIAPREPEIVASIETAPQPRPEKRSKRKASSSARKASSSARKNSSKPAPALECSASSFARVCRNENLSERQIQASLRRLKRCRGQLDSRQYSTIQSLLVSKL